MPRPLGLGNLENILCIFIYLINAQVLHAINV